MIVAEQKPLAEIMEMVADETNVLVLGCGTCVTVCFSGGEKEAEILSSSMRMKSQMEGLDHGVTHLTVQRQCEWEYLDSVAESIKGADVVVSLKDAGGRSFSVRPPVSPKEIGALHRLFLGANIEVSFLPDHHFLVAVDAAEGKDSGAFLIGPAHILLAAAQGAAGVANTDHFLHKFIKR